MNPGTGSYEVRARFDRKIVPSSDIDNKEKQNKQQFPKLLVFMDEDWDRIQELGSCEEKSQLSKADRDIILPLTSNEFGIPVTGKLQQNVKTRMWYFILTICENNNFHEIIQNQSRILKLDIELTLKNANDSHFSAGEDSQLALYFILTIICSLLFLFTLNQFILSLKKNTDFQSTEDFDWALFIILLAIFLQNSHFCLHTFNLYRYSQEGNHVFVIELFAQLSEIASAFLITFFLILVSWGWTINYMDLDSFDILIPLGMFVGIIQLLIAGVGKINDDSEFKFHPYDSWAGFVLVLIRMLLFLYFSLGIKNLYKNSRNQIQSFIKTLSIYGSLYLLAFPFLMIISPVFDQNYRYTVILIGSFTVQMTSLVILSLICTSSKSQYFQASLKARTFLPIEEQKKE